MQVMAISQLIARDFGSARDLSGIGGVETGADAAEFLLLGANSVQVGMIHVGMTHHPRHPDHDVLCTSQSRSAMKSSACAPMLLSSRPGAAAAPAVQVQLPHWGTSGATY